jgi:hypothetical protein
MQLPVSLIVDSPLSGHFHWNNFHKYFSFVICFVN